MTLTSAPNDRLLPNVPIVKIAAASADFLNLVIASSLFDSSRICQGDRRPLDGAKWKDNTSTHGRTVRERTEWKCGGK
jgi:hypothetical protein